MAGYIGSKASVVSSGAERKKTFTITTNTTSLTGLSYTVNQVHVFHNGVRLVDGTDYTATNGTSITLTSAAENGDEVVVISYAAFQTSDTVSASAGGTFSNAVTIDADGATALTVDRATSDGTIIDVQKGGTTVGSIGVDFSDNLFISGNSTHAGLIFGDTQVVPYKNGTTVDDTNSLGSSTARWKDLYLSGGVYLGGTGAANKLDDYEEGTWTPTPYQGSISFNKAWYIKIGNLVTVAANVWNFSDTTTSNGVGIKDLPFTSAISASAVGSMIGRNISSSTGYSSYIGANEAVVYFYEAPEASNTYEQMKHNDLTSSSDFHFCITYKVS